MAGGQRMMGLVFALAALFMAGAVMGEAPEWSVYRANIKAMQCPGVKGGTVGDALGAFLDYKFDLPLEFMRRAQVGGWCRLLWRGQVGRGAGSAALDRLGLFSFRGRGQAYVPLITPCTTTPQSFTGARTRLRRVVAEMIAGNKVEVAVLGGSISAGAIASRKMDPNDPNDVWSLVRLHLQNNVNPQIEFYNNARAATKSYITSLCIDRFLNTTADLVFVEFIANDGSEMDTQLQGPLEKSRSYERFLRKIQRQPSNPAVVMMQMLVSEMAIPPEGKDGKPKRAFYSTPEDTYGNLAQYYDIPSVSFRDALWQLGDNKRDGMSWDDFMAEDRLHPNDRGHRLMADMVIYLLQQTAIDLLMHPITTAEVADSMAALPPPMFQGERDASRGGLI